MKTIFKLLFMTLFFSQTTFSQGVQVLWEKQFGGSNWDMCKYATESLNGNYYLVGSAGSNDGEVFGNHGGGDYWVIKLNPQGDTLWTKCYGGYSNDEATYVYPTNDTGVIITGNSNSKFGEVYENYGESDFWIVKIDDSGHLQWSKVLGGNSYEESFVIKQTYDNGYIVGGHTESDNDGIGCIRQDYGGVWIAKLANNGDTVWTRRYGGGTPYQDDYAYDINLMNDSSYIVVGTTVSIDYMVHDNPGPDGVSSIWIFKIDKQGDTLWTRTFSGYFAFDYAYRSIKTPDNNILLLGRADLPISGYSSVFNVTSTNNVLVFKVNSMTGDMMWQHLYYGPSGIGWQAADIKATFDSSYIITGSYDSTGIVSSSIFSLKISLSGDSLWSVFFPDTLFPRYPHSIVSTSDGAFLITGEISPEEPSANYYDYFAIKFKIINSSVETKQLNKLSFLIYPNPCDGNFHIDIPNSHEKLYLSVFKTTGKLVTIIPMAKNKKRFNFNKDLPQGNYIISLSNNNTYSAKKLVVR